MPVFTVLNSDIVYHFIWLPIFNGAFPFNAFLFALIMIDQFCLFRNSQLYIKSNKCSYLHVTRLLTDSLMILLGTAVGGIL